MTVQQPVMSDAKRALMARMMRGAAGARPSQVAAIGRRPADAIVPLSAAQRQVWLHATMAPDVPLYNESITIHRLGRYDHDAMAASLHEILRRHEIWRTSFALDGAEPVQIVHPQVPLDLPLDDVSHLPYEERDAAALLLGTADAHRPIDLETAPLLRARIVKLADEEHRLYLTLHHIIFDGVAIYRVIVPELAALYAAFSAGQPTPLPEPEIGYADYAVWQQTYLESAAIQGQIDYWRRTLADAAPKLELVGDRPRPAVQTHAGSMENFLIPLDLTEALKDFSRRRGVTMYMTLLAGFKAMLHRYSGEEDIVVGGVTDLRRRPELERVVGYFLNTLSLRSRPAGDMTFDLYLEQVRDMMLGALGASEVPFDEVVRALDVRRTPGTHPLFNILFSVEPPVDPFPDGWDLTQMDVVVGGAKFDLYLELDERPEGMVGRFLYSTELFDPATIRRMIGHWLVLLEGVIADPQARIADLPLLTPGEATQIAVWNQTARALPVLTVPAAIAAQARATPAAPAIVYEDRSWSYAELDGHADRIAARLAMAGIGRGALVAVHLGRSPEMVAGLIGILRAGAAYLPLDPHFPRARLDQIVEDAGPDALLTDAALNNSLPLDVPVLLVDDDTAPPRSGEAPAIAGHDLAYVLYTSGSTGRPKGVEIEHDALTNLLATMADAPGFTAQDRLLAVTTLSFDIAALEIFLPLITGGRLILAPADVARDPTALAALIATARPTVMQATPATWRALIEAGWQGDHDLKILCGGEALPRPLADQLVARAGSLWNMYGPTETTIWSTIAQVTLEDGPVAIGRPIGNTGCYVLDANGRLVPPGAIGELFIGGGGLARGYRNRPDLTAERFGDKPFAPGLRLYRTGDLARQRADGTLFCLGRTDNDEKIRGFRVAVEEIEGALGRHDAIAAAAVRSWPDASGERALVAYLVAAGPGQLAPAELRRYLEAILPDYMIPSRYVYLATLPMTLNGKIDRKALPEPAGMVAPALFVPPATEDEHRLAGLWREVLGVDAIGRTDSFFDLGGHSLLVARLLRRVEAEFGCRMNMAAFFRAHRLDAMAAALGTGRPLDLEDVVPLQPNGWRPPVLWIEAGPTFVPLSEALGTDQPFLGISLNRLLERENGGDFAFTDFAAHVVSLIREIRPRGPYYIAGWCTSGILAFAVASQLIAAGEEVPLLMLAHAINPTEFERIGKTRLRLSKLHFHVRQLVAKGTAEAIGYLRARTMGLLEDLGLSRARTAVGTQGALRSALDRAAYRYRPEAYDGDVALFEPAERPHILDARRGWSGVVRGRFQAFQIPGGHSTMLETPHVDHLASRIRDVLLDAQARHGEAEREARRVA